VANVEDVLAQIASRKKGKKVKNKSRKIGRNLRYGGTIHSMTKYRAEGRRERNKARRAAQRARWLIHRKERNAVYLKEHRGFEVNEVHRPSRSGSSRREDQGRKPRNRPEEQWSSQGSSEDDQVNS
jgi:hypothetical protein